MGHTLLVTKADWLKLAAVIRDVRADVLARWNAAESANHLAAHDYKLIYFAQLEAVDQMARLLVLRFKGAQVDEEVFYRVSGVKPLPRR